MPRRPQTRLGLALAVPLMLVAVAGCAARSGGTSPAPTGRTSSDSASGAYGTASRGSRSRPAQVTRVTEADIDRAPNMNLATFIESRLSGVRVVANRGDYAVIISGMSFQSSVGALVIIDGTEGSLGGLTLQNISTMEVLKDSAASIYGVRGANGVLVITTRKR
jgi:TonB-dependent SusC/RagA subfamily outer membrane receptor